MKYTTNYNLKKPEETDNVNIEDFDENFDTIDEELKGNADDLIEHKNENASKHITESGSNENGTYIKFDDGTMICSARLTLDKISYSLAPNDTLVRTWVYPARFLNAAPAITGNVASEGGLTLTQKEITPVFAHVPYASQVALRIFALKGLAFSEGANCTVGVTAIGRWK